jgi:hypothetical protein
MSPTISVFFLTVPVLVGTVIFVLFNVLKVGRRAPGLPPGPPTIPILGNLHQVSNILGAIRSIGRIATLINARHKDANQETTSPVSEVGTGIRASDPLKREHKPYACSG